jgi:hypothetical protein
MTDRRTPVDSDGDNLFHCSLSPKLVETSPKRYDSAMCSTVFARSTMSRMAVSAVAGQRVRMTMSRCVVDGDGAAWRSEMNAR